MGYRVALTKSWDELSGLAAEKSLSVRFLKDRYTVDVKDRTIFSDSCNVPAKEYVGILILNYLIGTHRNLYEPVGQWISFKELTGGEGYWPAFYKRAVEPILRKYGTNPGDILSGIERLNARKADYGEPGIIIEAFEKVPVLVAMWPGDDEFSADANVLFDRNIERVLSTEAIVVMSEFIAKAL